MYKNSVLQYKGINFWHVALINNTNQSYLSYEDLPYSARLNAQYSKSGPSPPPLHWQGINYQMTLCSVMNVQVDLTSTGMCVMHIKLLLTYSSNVGQPPG